MAFAWILSNSISNGLAMTENQAQTSDLLAPAPRKWVGLVGFVLSIVSLPIIGPAAVTLPLALLPPDSAYINIAEVVMLLAFLVFLVLAPIGAFLSWFANSSKPSGLAKAGFVIGVASCVWWAFLIISMLTMWVAVACHH